MDHEDAKVWGNTGPATRELPAETNMRRGGFDAGLKRQYNKLVADLQKAGRSRAEAEKTARAAVQGEIDANKISPPSRSVNPKKLDKLPANPDDQGR
jgi:hypothetical protein